jgi:hypothetical protein
VRERLARSFVDEWAYACRREQLISFLKMDTHCPIRGDLNCVIG